MILLPRSQAYTATLDTPDWVVLGTYLGVVVLLVALTRGRLRFGAVARGREPAEPAGP